MFKLYWWLEVNPASVASLLSIIHTQLKRTNWYAEPWSVAQIVKSLTFLVEGNLRNLLGNLFFYKCGWFRTQWSPVVSSPAPVIKDARIPPALALQPEPSRHYPPSVIPSCSFPPVHSQPGASEGLWEISWHPPPLLWSAGDGWVESAVRLQSGTARHAWLPGGGVAPAAAGPGGAGCEKQRCERQWQPNTVWYHFTGRVGGDVAGVDTGGRHHPEMKA